MMASLGLLCIANTCISDDFALEPSSKVCVAAQCIDKSDCCKKSAAEVQQCKTYQEECTADPGGFYCVTTRRTARPSARATVSTTAARTPRRKSPSAPRTTTPHQRQA